MDNRRYSFRRKGGCSTTARGLNGAGGKFLLRENAFIDGKRLKRSQPMLIVRGGQVVHRIHALYGVTEGIEGVNLPYCQHRHGEHPPLPRRVEDGLVLFPEDRAKAGQPAHVMDTVHTGSPPIISEKR